LGAIIILLAVAFLLVGVIATISRIGEGPTRFRKRDAQPNNDPPPRAGPLPRPAPQLVRTASDEPSRTGLIARWIEWRRSMLGHRGDWLPIVIGSMLILISGPPFVADAIFPDPNSGALVLPLLILFATGLALGLAFGVVGIWLCARPGFRALFGRDRKDEMPAAVRRFLDS
jgi:hypothetical protein